MRTNSHFTKEYASSKSNNGRWTKEEHERFLEGLKIYGKNWKQVEGHIGTRNGAQIRSHAQKFFHRVQRDVPFDVSDTKSLREKLRISYKNSDASESTFHTKLYDLDREASSSTTGLYDNMSQSYFNESCGLSKEVSSDINEDEDDSKKVMEIYLSTKRFLGLPENDYFFLPISLPKRPSGFFDGFIDSFYKGKIDREAIQDTKLSQLLSFSDCSRENTNAPNSPERESFKPSSLFMEEKLKSLKDAPILPSNGQGFKRVKLTAAC